MNQAYKQIIELCKFKLKGHILLFSIGEKEIKNAVEYINKITPKNVVALPYYTKLHREYKDIIDNINIKLSTIKNKKENIYIEWSNEYVNCNNNNNNNFKYAIIVSTTIAEASITIPNLYYVIDIGFTKMNTYTDIRSYNSLKISHIAETNRLQRKGRVGRISPGEVYYMYPYKRKENVNFNYAITQSFIYKNLLAMTNIENKNVNNKNNNLLILNDINPNNHKTLNKDNKYNDSIIYKSGLIDIYIKNYNSSINKIEYINELYEYFYIYCNNDLKTSQKISNIFDYNCKFYIIHIFEDKITRNILNDIIYYNKIKTNVLLIDEYCDFILYLSSLNIIYSNINDYNLFKISNIMNEIDFTFMFKIFSNIETILLNKKNNKIFGVEINYGYCQTIITSYILGCLNEVYHILIFLYTINFSINNIIPIIKYNNNPKFSIQKKNINNDFIKMYKYLNSDIIFIHTIINNFKSNFKFLYLYSDTKKSFNDIILNINKNEYLIRSWCDKNIINFDFFIKYIKNIIFIEEDIYNIKEILKNYNEYNNYFINNINIIFNNINEKIIFSFLSGFPLQIMYNDIIYNYKNSYLYINKYNSISLCNINTFKLYLQIRFDENININIISYIKKEWINITNNSLIKNIQRHIKLFNGKKLEINNSLIYDNNKNIYETFINRNI